MCNQITRNRIIYYYQTFVGLKPILVENTPVTHIHLSAVHFGKNKDGTPYIHINDNTPEDPKFDTLWEDIKKASQIGIKIILMVGGAGSAFTDLFNNFDTYYPMLVDTIKKHPEIVGIDLDVEEEVELDNIKMLINKIDQEFGKDFIIAMAPVQGSLQYDDPGMGGFIYKDLFKSDEGQRINYFDGQFYFEFSLSAYEDCINNGYPSEKAVIGMENGSIDFNNVMNTVKEIKEKYPNFGGVYDWEYWNAPPGGKTHPEDWCFQISKILKNNELKDSNELKDGNELLENNEVADYLNICNIL